MAAVGIAAILLAIAFPQFNRLRLSYAFSGATEDARQMVDRARWRAINSGRTTRIALTGTVLEMRDDATSSFISSIDLAQNYVTATATNFPIVFDTRGFVAGTPTLTIANSAIAASRVLTINAVGRVS